MQPPPRRMQKVGQLSPQVGHRQHTSDLQTHWSVQIQITSPSSPPILPLLAADLPHPPSPARSVTRHHCHCPPKRPLAESNLARQLLIKAISLPFPPLSSSDPLLVFSLGCVPVSYHPVSSYASPNMLVRWSITSLAALAAVVEGQTTTPSTTTSSSPSQTSSTAVATHTISVGAVCKPLPALKTKDVCGQLD